MATKKTKKPKSVTFYFDNKETCQGACEFLGVSLRKCADLDKKHSMGYSKRTGHYGQKVVDGKVYKTPLRFKLTVEETELAAFTIVQLESLGHLDDTMGWCVE